MTYEISRRTALQGAGAGAFALFLSNAAPAAADAPASLRAVYHMTPPSGWLCDPQRPVHTNGAYQLYYLHSGQNNGPGGWDHATTGDGVAFTHHGVVMPLQPDFPVWSGSAVVDTANTAGFGAGAVVALATQPTGGIRKFQEQYLYWSTDGGYTFSALPDPVIVNTDGRTATTQAEIENAEWFRDPKIHWDGVRNEWVCVIGRARYAAFYTSANLRDWNWKSNFDYPNHALGGIECPDLFEMTADDGTRHWVFGASMDAYSVELPMTFAYWMGAWNGTAFVADDLTPQWLDWGWDWYAAVTWPSVEAPETKRLAIAWMNNWKYAARDVPTDASDGYNGQNSITRELRLERQSGGWYSLLSSPVGALQGHVTATTALPDRTVNGSVVLPWSGRAYELELHISWNLATNVGVSVGRSPDGSRHTNIGKYGDELYVDRAPSDQSGYTLMPYVRAAAPIDANARSVHLRIFVDTQSVEVFVNSGHTVISQQVHFADGDTGLSLYADGGPADFTGITIREFGNPL
ncbi:glycoside hydrolase family 32 protein [Paenarthrobacter nitroguajacolicus]|uniref:glycoside hydrolase family 32 protein n=1 Tax=Paenarthrobacter nitroguajacolicus TaxID=211146 RepID=UPI0015C164DE|nr:glycoside hydrolase family 32 protein [Paenarthrobacter nitroguajacolicus]NWL35612.1 glycosyl hydrolase family 32 [Paenarthrobacter nitroguajacolicus]